MLRISAEGTAWDEKQRAEIVTVKFDPRDEWVYVSRRNGVTRMWTGGACSECSVDLLSVRRCAIHEDLVMVAVQCRLL